MKPIDTNGVSKAISAVKTATEIAEPFAKIMASTSKSSIMRITKDQVFQFPVIMNGDIDDDEKYPIIKSLERNYASIILIAIVNSGRIDRDKYGDTNKFLRKFHNNASVPVFEGNFEVTSAIASEGYMPKKELLEMWDCIEEQLDTESINDMYRPYKRTEAKLKRAIESANDSIAMEADDERYFRRPELKRSSDGKILSVQNTPIVDTDKDGGIKYQYIKVPEDEISRQKLEKLYGAPKSMSEWNRDPHLEINAKSRIHGEFVKDEKFNALSPTIIRTNLANTESKIGSWNQELILGVRAMPRILPQSIIVSNMVEAFKNRPIFNFIKVTRGEMPLREFLFGVNEAREDARAKADTKWLKVYKNLAKKDKLYRLIGKGLNPNCTVIITDADVHLIQEQCGVDVRKVENVKRMMSKYFFLAFGIYDTEAKMLDIIYDGENEYTTYSLRNMIAESKKDINLLAMNRY